MIAGIIKNSAVNSKILAMNRNILTFDDYIKLSKFDSLEKAAQYLSQSSQYSEIFKDLNPSSSSAYELEILLKGTLNRNIKSLITFLVSCSSPSASFFNDIFSVKDDIAAIKASVRHIFTKDSTYKQNIFYFNSKTFEKLTHVTDFNGFFVALNDTVYEGIFKSFAQNPQRQNLFDIECAIDSFWCKYIFKSIKNHLEKSDLKIARSAYGVRFELNLLLFILRLKKYYKKAFPPEKIFPYVNIFHHRLSSDEIQKIVEAENEEKTLSILMNTPYSAVFSNNYRFFEKPAEEYILKLYSSLYRSNPYSIAAILYYLCIQKNEIKNIITTIEGLRLKLSPAQIQKHIRVSA